MVPDEMSLDNSAILIFSDDINAVISEIFSAADGETDFILVSPIGATVPIGLNSGAGSTGASGGNSIEIGGITSASAGTFSSDL